MIFSFISVLLIFQIFKLSNSAKINGLYDIEGVLMSINDFSSCDLNSVIQLHSNSGLIISYPDTNCVFHAYNIPSGSYLLEIVNTTYFYEPLRIEINSKGKIRARKVDFVQSTQIIAVAYPLRLRPLGRYKYFQTRDTFNLFDFFSNPMILLIVLPVMLIMVLPKLANDPETKREMSQLNTNFEMPDMSDFMTSFFKTTPLPVESSSKSKSNKKRN